MTTHQEWLHAAYAAIRAELLPEAPAPERVIISYGFPKGVRGGRSSSAIGQCRRSAAVVGPARDGGWGGVFQGEVSEVRR